MGSFSLRPNSFFQKSSFQKMLNAPILVLILTHFFCVTAFTCTSGFDTARANFRMSASPKIALTREAGTNTKLSNLLKGLDCHEIPCIQFFGGTDVARLSEEMKKNDITILTSPQGADVFLKQWEACGSPQVKIAVVGKGTAEPLKAKGLYPIFQPSDFTAVVLAKELPMEFGVNILYPTSSLADTTLQEGLSQRGFKVTRLNSYTTGPAIWTPDMLTLAKSIDIVTFASPSAIKTWIDRVGTTTSSSQIAVTIGPTSEKAALKGGFNQVYSPNEGSKGVEVWANLIRDIASNIVKK